MPASLIPWLTIAPLQRRWSLFVDVEPPLYPAQAGTGFAP